MTVTADATLMPPLKRTKVTAPELKYNPDDPFGDGLSVEDMVVRERANVLQNRQYVSAWSDFCNHIGQDKTKAVMDGSLSIPDVDDLIADYLKKRTNKRVKEKVVAFLFLIIIRLFT